MTDNTLILGEGKYFNMDCHKTKLNNNVLIVGASGSGKTRSFVIPNLIQATGSYVISDPKGNLYRKYGAWLEKKGYLVKRLDFTKPLVSERYNLFRYIHDEQDIVKLAHMLIGTEKNYSKDPFWDESAQLLVQAILAYLWEKNDTDKQNLHYVLELLRKSKALEDMITDKSELDSIMETHRKLNNNSYACPIAGKTFDIEKHMARLKENCYSR